MDGSPLFDSSFQDKTTARVLVHCATCGTLHVKRRDKIRAAAYVACSRVCQSRQRAARQRAAGVSARSFWRPGSAERQAEAMRGERNPHWQGGLRRYRNGRLVPCPLELRTMTPRPDGRVWEHRLVVAQAIGRLLRRGEVVHHVDHDTRNNAVANLWLFQDNRTHRRHECGAADALPIWRGDLA